MSITAIIIGLFLYFLFKWIFRALFVMFIMKLVKTAIDGAKDKATKAMEGLKK